MSDLVRNTEDRFSLDLAHLRVITAFLFAFEDLVKLLSLSFSTSEKVAYARGDSNEHPQHRFL